MSPALYLFQGLGSWVLLICYQYKSIIFFQFKGLSHCIHFPGGDTIGRELVAMEYTRDPHFFSIGSQFRSKPPSGLHFPAN